MTEAKPVEVTPEMLAAGVRQLRRESTTGPDDNERDVVECVYRAMALLVPREPGASAAVREAVAKSDARSAFTPVVTPDRRVLDARACALLLAERDAR